MNEIGTAQSRRKACVRCAAAKAKCSFGGAEKGCDRCRRLKRECILEEAPRRKKQKQSTRVKALEEKVDSLLTLLGPKPVVCVGTPAPTEDNGSPACGSNVSTAPSTIVGESSRFDVIENKILTLSTADALLNKYKNVYSKFFPFVIVAPEIDAARLREQSPFLFLAIMTASLEGDHMLQRRLGVDLKRILCERVIIGNERNIDLLQGLLVQLGWSHFHFNPMNKQLYMLLQIAIGLVTDLDLDRCPAHRDQRVASNLCYLPSNGDMLGQSKLSAQCRRSFAEIRALLGCFYLSSSMAMMRKELASTHTTWIDNCCRILQDEQEYATDAYALALVNIRCLVQSAGERFSYDDPTLARFQNDAVVQMALNGLKKEVEKLEANPAFSPEHNNYVLIAELKALPITIHEVALYRDWDFTTSSSAQSSYLWNLLSSARDFLNYALSIPSEVIKHLPSTFFNLLPYALIVLSNVARLPSTIGWDSSIAKQEADVTSFGLRIKAKFGDELTKTGPDVSIEKKDVWQFFSRGIYGMVAWHQRCESSAGTEGEVDVPISSPGFMNKCGLADTLTALGSMRLRKPVAMNVGNVVQEQVGANAVNSNDVNRSEIQPDMLTNLWEDEAWQSILDNFSMFPTTAGFPVG